MRTAPAPLRTLTAVALGALLVLAGSTPATAHASQVGSSAVGSVSRVQALVADAGRTSSTVDRRARWKTAASSYVPVGDEVAAVRARQIDVRATIGGNAGVTDDYTKLRGLTASLDGRPTVLLMKGDFRIGRGENRHGEAALLIEDSNVTLRWAKGSRLVMDNLSPIGTGDQTHGIMVRGDVQNVDLGDFRVEWKHTPTARSLGDGVQINGRMAIDASKAPRNIRWGSGTVLRAPQAGLIAHGAGQIVFDSIRVEDNLADGVHFNAGYVGPVGNRVVGINNGDDTLAFVTYHSASRLTAYGDDAPPYTSPDLKARNNNGAVIGSVYSRGGAANGVRINAVDGVRIDHVEAVDKEGAALIVDGTVADGKTFMWSVLASRRVSVGRIDETRCGTGLLVISQNVPGWRTDDARARFDVHVESLTTTDTDQYDLYVESARGVRVDAITASGEIRVRNFRDVSLGTIHGNAWLNVVGSSVATARPLKTHMPVHGFTLDQARLRKASFSNVRGVSTGPMLVTGAAGRAGLLEDVVDFRGLFDVVDPNRFGHTQTHEQFALSLLRVVDSQVDLTVQADARHPVRPLELSGGVPQQRAVENVNLRGSFRLPNQLPSVIQTWSGGQPVDSTWSLQELRP